MRCNYLFNAGMRTVDTVAIHSAKSFNITAS